MKTICKWNGNELEPVPIYTPNRNIGIWIAARIRKSNNDSYLPGLYYADINLCVDIMAQMGTSPAFATAYGPTVEVVKEQVGEHINEILTNIVDTLEGLEANE